MVLLKHGSECKRMDAPRLTPSMRTAIDELKLDRLAVVYPGILRYRLTPRITVVPVEAIAGGIKSMFGKKKRRF